MISLLTAFTVRKTNNIWSFTKFLNFPRKQLSQEGIEHYFSVVMFVVVTTSHWNPESPSKPVLQAVLLFVVVWLYIVLLTYEWIKLLRACQWVAIQIKASGVSFIFSSFSVNLFNLIYWLREHFSVFQLAEKQLSPTLLQPPVFRTPLRELVVMANFRLAGVITDTKA